MATVETEARPPPAPLGLWDAVSLIVGIIVGVGIFETPPQVLERVPGPTAALAVWAVFAYWPPVERWWAIDVWWPEQSGETSREGMGMMILFGALLDLTGVRSSAFMLLYGVVWVSLVWMYWTEVRRTDVMGSPVPQAA